MRYILICTEGENSEPESVEQINVALFGNAAGNAHAEIIPITLGGNHGYTRLIKHANRAIEDCGITEFIEDGEPIEKYLICDYDDIDEKDITVGQLRERAITDGYILIVNKPNFEFFVLTLLLPIEDALKINKTNFIGKINEQIEVLNSAEGRVLEVPKYGKRKRQAERCISKLLMLRPTILEKMCELEPDLAKEYYSEMPILIRELVRVKEEN